MKHCVFMQECTPFIGENHNAKVKVNEQNPNAVVIVKKNRWRVSEDQGNWPWADVQHVVYFFSETVKISN